MVIFLYKKSESMKFIKPAELSKWPKSGEMPATNHGYVLFIPFMRQTEGRKTRNSMIKAHGLIVVCPKQQKNTN